MNRYTGRFAPSPTGPLHFGSLIAAVGSYLQARSQQGLWLLRMEDLDPPREIPGAADDIVETLEIYGFQWDSEIIYQSTRASHYEAALDQLRHRNHVYPCTCSRKMLQTRAKRNDHGLIYPGLCRDKQHDTRLEHALRVRSDAADITFTDQLQGRYSQQLATEVGDFIVKRRDGMFSYQLAVVVDDAEQNVTEVVRGADLLDNTPRQIYLQRRLGLPTPGYLHLPIAVNVQDQKLSKQTLAQPIPRHYPQQQLRQALSFLGQNPPLELLEYNLDEFWKWAITNWNMNKIPGNLTIRIQ